MEKKEEPIIHIKPTYQYAYEIIYRSGITILLLILFIYPAYKTGLLIGYSIFLLIYVIYLIISNILRKKKYEVSYFDFYEDRLIYQNKRKKQKKMKISYKRIESLRYRQLVLQRFFNRGDLLIKVKDKPWFKDCIFIYSVSDVLNEYKKLEELIHK